MFLGLQFNYIFCLGTSYLYCTNAQRPHHIVKTLKKRTAYGWSLLLAPPLDTLSYLYFELHHAHCQHHTAVMPTNNGKSWVNHYSCCTHCKIGSLEFVVCQLGRSKQLIICIFISKIAFLEQAKIAMLLEIMKQVKGQMHMDTRALIQSSSFKVPKRYFRSSKTLTV